MRAELKRLEHKVIMVSATVHRRRLRKGYKVVLLLNPESRQNRLSSHLWMKVPKRDTKWNSGNIISFKGKVVSYVRRDGSRDFGVDLVN